jgi:hypothetical protein
MQPVAGNWTRRRAKGGSTDWLLGDGGFGRPGQAGAGDDPEALIA